MIEPDFLRLLRCPETCQELRVAEPALIEQINREIAAGAVQTCAGQLVREPIEGALIRADGKYLYPIRQRIPVLLVDEALPLTRRCLEPSA